MRHKVLQTQYILRICVLRMKSVPVQDSTCVNSSFPDINAISKLKKLIPSEKNKITHFRFINYVTQIALRAPVLNTPPLTKWLRTSSLNVNDSICNVTHIYFYIRNKKRELSLLSDDVFLSYTT